MPEAAAPLGVVRVPIASLVPDPANARLHGDENLEAIIASLRRFGQAEPLIVQEGTNRVIAGNGRLVAMKKLCWQEADIVFLKIDNLEATALGIALNRTAELASWDNETLAKLLQELRAEQALDGTGFDTSQIDELLAELADANQGEYEEDVPPEPMDDAVSASGEVWLLGDHRVMCGDSAKREDLERLLAGARINLVNSDPLILGA